MSAPIAAIKAGDVVALKSRIGVFQIEARFLTAGDGNHAYYGHAELLRRNWAGERQWSRRRLVIQESEIMGVDAGS